MGITEFEHIHMHINLDVVLLLILFFYLATFDTKLSIVNGKQMHMCCIRHMRTLFSLMFMGLRFDSHPTAYVTLVATKKTQNSQRDKNTRRSQK